MNISLQNEFTDLKFPCLMSDYTSDKLKNILNLGLFLDSPSGKIFKMGIEFYSSTTFLGSKCQDSF